MRTNTRYVLLGGGGVLALGLLAGGAAYMQDTLPALVVAQSGPDELRFVPADATVVAYANVREVMLSNFRERLRDVQPDLDGQQEFKDETGIDLENDIDQVVASLSPGGTDQEPNGMVLLSGRFDVPRLEALALLAGTVQEYAGRRLFTRVDDDDSSLSMSFVEAGVLALGSGVMVRRAIDLSTGGEDVTSNERLMRLMSYVRDANNAWAVAEFGGTDALSFLPEQVAAQIPPLTAMAIGGNINGGVSADLTVETRDEQAGQDLRDVALGFIALARMQTTSRPELRSLLDSIQLTGTGTTVTLAFDLPAEILELAFPDSPDEPR